MSGARVQHGEGASCAFCFTDSDLGCRVKGLGSLGL